MFKLLALIFSIFLIVDLATIFINLHISIKEHRQYSKSLLFELFLIMLIFILWGNIYINVKRENF